MKKDLPYISFARMLAILLVVNSHATGLWPIPRDRALAERRRQRRRAGGGHRKRAFLFRFRFRSLSFAGSARERRVSDMAAAAVFQDLALGLDLLRHSRFDGNGKNSVA